MKKMDVKEKVMKKLEKVADTALETGPVCGLFFGEIEIPQSMKQECLKRHEKE